MQLQCQKWTPLENSTVGSMNQNSDDDYVDKNELLEEYSIDDFDELNGQSSIGSMTNVDQINFFFGGTEVPPPT